MQLGKFSISLTVKDLSASRAFYETLGFSQVHGDADQGWLILSNEQTTIGLFQGMFEKNLMTFNPGWDQDGNPVTDFMDIRDIQVKLKAANISLDETADETTTGPASLMLTDPDGNQILIDQHV